MNSDCKRSYYRTPRSKAYLNPQWIHVDDQRPGEGSVITVQYEGAEVKAEYRKQRFWDFLQSDKMLDVDLWKYIIKEPENDNSNCD